MTLKTLCVFGTRPEAIKMAPVIDRLSKAPHIQNQVCVTGQHQEMLTPVLDLFNITPAYNLNVMAKEQTLEGLTSKILQGLSPVLQAFKPHLVLVHGDTTSTLAASLAAYYHQTPIAHIEAGLRTGDLYQPWPEEANRKLAGALTMLHFAPTLNAKHNLLLEGIHADSIYVTGNTVIDALFEMVSFIDTHPNVTKAFQQQFPMTNSGKKIILVTGHRRENFGEGFERICQALKIIAEQHEDVEIIYPVHLNPNVQAPVQSILGGIPNIHLMPPVDYLPFVYLMKSSYLILTDSGGVQEEAPSLGKPVLVMRELTERPEAVEAGTVSLVGTDIDKIVSQVTRLLIDKDAYLHMSRSQNPYGDGEAANRIVDIISKQTEAIMATAMRKSHPSRHEKSTKEASIL